MAFLDELKKEAQAIKSQEDNLTQMRAQELTQNFLLMQSKLKMAYLYMVELAKNLNVVSIAANRSYYIDGFGSVDDFRPEKYVVTSDRMSIDQKEFFNVLYLKFTCKSDQAITFDKNGASSIEMERQYLWQSNLKFQCSEFKNAKGTVDRASFTVTNEIPVLVKWSADFEKGNILIFIKNFNGLTAYEYTYDVDEIDTPFMDELAKYLLGKPSRFLDLGRHQQALKERVSIKRPTSDVAYTKLDPGAEARLDNQNEGKKGLFGAIKSLLKGG
ncbi:MAG: hypothetical protein Q8O37_05160 [Sulfuricellaceae bacterium]|nr:hypothetical protein [Sulfuricellaceae bacterium]